MNKAKLLEWLELSEELRIMASFEVRYIL